MNHRHTDNKKTIPTKVEMKTISTENDMLLDLIHPKHKTMVVYQKNGHTISAMRRTGSKTWVILDGRVIRPTEIKRALKAFI